jgi:hypothetical protein
MIKDALLRLDRYCKAFNYKGWDLFDGLNSTFFKESPLYSSRFLRLVWIQFFKRFPLNLRKIAFVKKGLNPKGLALFASGLIAQNRLNEAKRLLDSLQDMACQGYSGVSWGYNFPWQARAFYVPVGTPNMVTTVFVANAFLDYFEYTGYEEAIDLGRGCCEFILEHLVLYEDENTLCFGYIPGENAKVHNANMLGAALMARVYKFTGDEKYLEKSRKSITYSMRALNPEYLWPYGERDHHRFIDNFHTGFNLVALKQWMDFTGESIWVEQVKHTYQKFLNTFWLENGCPKYFHNQLYPIDIHCSAQGIITCLKLSDYDGRSRVMVEKIASWAIKNMQDKVGYFYYQKTRLCTNKIPYIRWSQAWMFYALALLLAEGNKEVSQ